MSSAFMSVLVVVSVGSDPLSVRPLCSYTATLAEFLCAFIKFGSSSAAGIICVIWSEAVVGVKW